MPTLPTLTLSQAHYDRVVAAFPGETLAEKAASYQGWLTNRLIDYVFAAETVALEAQLQVERATRQQQIRDSLPPRVAEGPTPPPTPQV